jgi:hypothetical protein
MSRSTNHPDVRAVVRALDRAERSDAMIVVGSTLATLGSDCEHFDRRDRPKWSNDAIRAVVLAHALNAPDEELRYMAKRARAEMKWCDDYDRVSAAGEQEATVQ